MNADIHQVYISLGSNISPAKNLRRAVELLRQYMRILAISTTWENPPVGTTGQNFLNTALWSQSDRSLEDLKMEVLRPIETQLGRVRTQDKYAPRPMDLDIIIYDGFVLDPRLWTLPYLAVPFSEIIPEFRNPNTDQTLKQIADDILSSHQDLIPRHDVLLQAENTHPDSK